MATQKDIDKLKDEMQDANTTLNESSKERNDKFVINSVADNSQTTSTQSTVKSISPGEKPVVQNSPKLLDEKSITDKLQNKSIVAQSAGNHGLSAEIEKLIAHLGELKAKIVAFEHKFATECETEIKHLKSLL